MAQPVEGAEVLFQADAEDEFEVLDAAQDWVHIQISGISRGWIKRDHVDLPGAATVSVAAIRRPARHSFGPPNQGRSRAVPGKWEPLNGKQVKIIWVQPEQRSVRLRTQVGSGQVGLSRSRCRRARGPNEVAGVVVIFDSEDGGMAATTLANLQQWRAGHLSDDSILQALLARSGRSFSRAELGWMQ